MEDSKNKMDNKKSKNEKDIIREYKREDAEVSKAMQNTLGGI